MLQKFILGLKVVVRTNALSRNFLEIRTVRGFRSPQAYEIFVTIRKISFLQLMILHIMEFNKIFKFFKHLL